MSDHALLTAIAIGVGVTAFAPLMILSEAQSIRIRYFKMTEAERRSIDDAEFDAEMKRRGHTDWRP